MTKHQEVYWRGRLLGIIKQNEGEPLTATGLHPERGLVTRGFQNKERAGDWLLFLDGLRDSYKHKLATDVVF